MSKVKNKSPLAPLFQRGEQKPAPWNRLSSPFGKGGPRGIFIPLFEKEGLGEICRCAVSPSLNEVWVA